MASMNFCPYPVEPWKLIMITTYPDGCDEVGDANSSGFQRYDQSSPQAPCGPPWMRNFTGYFFEASKFGGLTRKPSTLSPFAPANQKDSSGDMETSERRASFTCVKAFAVNMPNFCSGWRGVVLSFCDEDRGILGGALVGICQISVGARSDILVNNNVLPSGVTTGPSLYPRTTGMRSLISFIPST